jgi:hypothetical protein
MGENPGFLLLPASGISHQEENSDHMALRNLTSRAIPAIPEIKPGGNQNLLLEARGCDARSVQERAALSSKQTK